MHTTTTSNNNNKTNGTSGGVGGKVGIDRDVVSNGGLSIEKGQKRKCDGSFFIRHKKKRKGTEKKKEEIRVHNKNKHSNVGVIRSTEEYEEDTNITSHRNQFIKNPHKKQGTGDTRRNTIPCGVSPIDNACVTANGGDTFKHGGGAVGSGGTRHANLNS